MLMSRLLRLALGLAFASILAASPAVSDLPSDSVKERLGELLPWNRAVNDPARADSAYREIGKLISANPDSTYRAFGHYLRFAAAMTLERPDSMLASADSSFRYSPTDASALIEAGMFLAQRKLRLEDAERALSRGLAASSHLSMPAPLAYQRLWLGRVRQILGNEAGAIEAWEAAKAGYPQGDAWLQRTLGQVYARQGKSNEAIEELIGAAGAWQGDSSDVAEASAFLDSLVGAQGGSLDDIHARVRAGRERARQAYFFDAHLDDRPVPKSTLRDLATGKSTTLDFRKGTTLVDFWGLWCGPCLVKMPGLNELAARYRDRGVRVLTIHVDPGAETPPGPRVFEFFKKRGISLPAFEGDSAAVANWRVGAYPTTFIVRDGRILYRNEGGQEDVLEEQLKSLLPARAAPPPSPRGLNARPSPRP
jgi:thiol-disulfide isomerase/thioredoxin